VTALIDTNVVLDVMLCREPHVGHSSAMLAAIESGHCRGLRCATTLTTIHYVARRQIGSRESLARIAELLSIFGVAAVNQAVMASAITRELPDFEDAVLHESALQAAAQCIVTRNQTDFRGATIPFYSPAQWIAAFGNGNGERRV